MSHTTFENWKWEGIQTFTFLVCKDIFCPVACWQNIPDGQACSSFKASYLPTHFAVIAHVFVRVTKRVEHSLSGAGLTIRTRVCVPLREYSTTCYPDLDKFAALSADMHIRVFRCSR